MKQVIKSLAKKYLPQKIKNRIKRYRDKTILKENQTIDVVDNSNLTNGYINLKENDLKVLRYYFSLDNDQLKIPDMLAKILFSEKELIIFPLNYDLKLGQRPDEILLALAKTNNYNCLILSYDNVENHINQISENFYITSLLWEVLALIRDRTFTFLFTHPRYMCFRDLFPNAIFIFDCLDEPSVLADYFYLSYEQDYLSAICGSDITLYSSEYLYDKFSTKSKQPILLKNGINPDRYVIENKNRKLYNDNERIFGYVGVISELIDFDFLEALATYEKSVKVILIGPVKAFEFKNETYLNKRFNQLLQKSNVNHIPFIEKNEIASYIQDFDFGIIPFVISDKTNGVLPLKLFEYMILSKRVIATKTLELLKFQNFIHFYDGTNDSIKNLMTANQKLDYSSFLAKHFWKNLIGELNSVLDSQYVIFNNTSKKQYVDILNFQYYNFDGNYLYKGGAERYVYDLAVLLEQLGYRPRIIQQSKYYFYQFVNHHIPVIGLPTFNGTFNDVEKFKYYYSNVFPHGSMAICSPFELCINLKQYLGENFPIIGINHGIYWDSTNTNLKNLDLYFFEKVINSIKNADNTVCVDTNFINWLRTVEYKSSLKTTYLPNYYDKEYFYKYEKDFTQPQIHICYPRRVYPARGSDLLFPTISYICQNYKNVVFDIVGQFHTSNEEEQFNFLKTKYTYQINHYEYEMNDMPKAYANSHIILVPTAFSEGTSLSCIEAMATNNGIIATNVGGLPNLIIDHFNGLLINPDEKSLIKAIEFLLNDRNLLQKMATNALHISKVFEKDNWECKWENIINFYLAKE